MLKDIEIPSPSGVGLALIWEENEQGEQGWNAYLVNYTNQTLEGVLVSSQGWGIIEGEERKTSQLRHFLGSVEPLSYKKIELLPQELTNLNNQYWFSSFANGTIQEYKFIFEPGSIDLVKSEKINLLNKPGILLLS